jgi:hypothetical protein
MQGSKWIPVVLNGRRVNYPVMREQKYGQYLPYYPSEYDERNRKGVQWPFIVKHRYSVIKPGAIQAVSLTVAKIHTKQEMNESINVASAQKALAHKKFVQNWIECNIPSIK